MEAFRWVDDAGIVHYSEFAPDGIENFERVTVTLKSGRIVALSLHPANEEG